MGKILALASQKDHMNVPDLHCHSTYSLNDGFGTPKQIVERAVELGWSAAAITEHGWLGSAPAFYKACVEAKHQADHRLRVLRRAG